jgi:dihydrofolate reductase
MITIIACMARNRVIGRGGKLPWRFPADLKHFKSKTLGNKVLMGRKTFDAVGKLPRRQFLVLTRGTPGKGNDGTVWINDITPVIESKYDVFVAGGAEIYKLFLDIADQMMLTYIHQEIEGDTYFPEFDPDPWNVTYAHRGNQHSYIELKRKT